MPEIIRLGDPTSHGGKVLEGSPTDICHGKPIAYMGYKVNCPQCKSVFPIVEGVLTTSFYGKGVAVAGMKAACGAVLIAMQFTDTVKWSSEASGSSASASAQAAAALAAVVSGNRKQQISNIANARPDPEVVPTGKRRSFSTTEKLRILAAADACVAPGDIGALLRREGIYSSHLATWREQHQLAGEASWSRVSGGRRSSRELRRIAWFLICSPRLNGCAAS